MGNIEEALKLQTIKQMTWDINQWKKRMMVYYIIKSTLILHWYFSRTNVIIFMYSIYVYLSQCVPKEVLSKSLHYDPDGYFIVNLFMFLFPAYLIYFCFYHQKAGRVGSKEYKEKMTRRFKKQRERQNLTRDISIGPHRETDEEEDEDNEFLPRAVYPEMAN